MSISGSSRSLLARFEVGQGSETLYGRFEAGQNFAGLIVKTEVQHSGSAELLGKGDVQQSGSVELLGGFNAQVTAELLGRFEVGQGSAELLSKAIIRHSASAELLDKAVIRHVGNPAEFLGKFEVGQNSAEFLGKFEIGQSSTELLGEFEAQATAELLGNAEIQQSGSAELLGRFEIGRGSAELLGRVEIGRGSAELLGRFEVGQGSAELLGKFEAQTTADLLGRFEAQATAELLGKFDVGQNSIELLGNAVIRHVGTPVELLGKAIIRHSAYTELLGRLEVGQGSAELLGKFEAQAIAELLGRFEAQVTAELLGKCDVGQNSTELLGNAVIRHSASVELLGKFETQATAELLGRAIIEHPALPVWLYAIFSIGLTNAYRDLELIIRLRHDGTPVELLFKAVVRHPDSEELLGKGVVRNLNSADLLGKGDVQQSESAELLCSFAAQGVADLRASVIIGPTRDSDAYISFFDPSDWINEVVGVGQGFITIPMVEADADVKTCGTSSAKLTSISGPDQYKEIRFGWGGMNWGVEAAVFPEVAPTPIDTGGRGPRRGSRASRDWRREVPQSSHEDLVGRFVTQAINDLKASFFAMVNYTSWTMVWSRNYGAAALLDGIYVDDLGNCYFTDGDNSDAYFRSLLGVESTSSDYDYAIQRRAGLPIAVSQGSIGYVLGENEAVYMQFDVRRYGAIVASFNLSTDNPDLDQWLAYAMSSNGKYIAFVVSGLAEGARYVMLYEGS